MSFDPTAQQFSPDDIAFLHGIRQKVAEQGMFDLDEVVNALVVALIGDGHVLLEGNPGLGKTALVRALSAALGLGTKAVGRIQFTPDLMPVDILGTKMPVPGQVGELRFSPGPIFCQLLLADEINRATPKTQSAMLEAMAEFQVTVMGETMSLRTAVKVQRGRRIQSIRPPFMVMATQNPIDQDGTYDLPEAQQDRFQFKIRMAMPSAATIRRIIDKELADPGRKETQAEAEAATEQGQSRIDTDLALAQLRDARMALSGQRLPDAVAVQVVNVVLATNARFDQVAGLSTRRRAALEALVGDRVTYPLGPRAATALARGALGWAAVALTPPVEAQTVASRAGEGLAFVAVPALRHRLRLRPGAGHMDSVAAEDDQRDAWLRELVLAAAPDLAQGQSEAGYHERFAAFQRRAAGCAL